MKHKNYEDTWNHLLRVLKGGKPKEDHPKVFQSEAEWSRHQRWDR